MSSQGIRIWDRVRPLLSRGRYQEIHTVRQDETELNSIHRSTSPLSAPSTYGRHQSHSKKVSQIEESHELLGRTTPDTKDNKAQHAGWIAGVSLCAKGSAVVLMINVLFIAIAAGLARNHPTEFHFDGSLVFYEGNCGLSKRWDVALHLVINVLSTCILAASNYCMQTLVAPTREEIDESHDKQRWLDIGTASMRNLFVIGPRRLALWVILMMTATPFHLLYNSMVFEALATNEFGIYVGPKDLNSQNVWNLTTPAVEKCFAHPAAANIGDLTWKQFASEIAAGNFQNLTSQQCMGLTTKTNTAGVKALIALADDLSVNDGGNVAILSTGAYGGTTKIAEEIVFYHRKILATSLSFDTIVVAVPRDVGIGYYQTTNFTIEGCQRDGSSKTSCSDAGELLHWAESYRADNMKTAPTIAQANEYIQANLSSEITYDHFIDCTGKSPGDFPGNQHTVTKCLAIKANERCQLLFSPPIAILICLVALAKVTAMFLAARIGRSRPAPLLTVGDAVASFMARPDPTTEGLCWVSQGDIKGGTWRRRHQIEQAETSTDSSDQGYQRVAVNYRKLQRRKFYVQIPSIQRWAITLFLCLGFIAAGAWMLEDAIGYYFINQVYLSSWWNAGFDSRNAQTVSIAPGRLTMLSSVVIANTPQIILTLSYYCYNSILTNMLASGEYSSYGATRKPLRVTWPVKDSQQRSTYWLSVPYHYAIPILSIYGVLHWLISQSIFYVLVIPYNLQNQPNYKARTSALGYSPLPIFLSLLVGGLMMCILFGVACKRLKSDMPLAGSCSAAISAACHPPKDEDLDTAALGPVKWGHTLASPVWMKNLDHYTADGDVGDTGHCSFTSLETVKPTLTKLYA